MAQYDITYKCGHTIRKQLIGKINDRMSYIEWCKDNLCPECVKKHSIEKADKVAKEMGLPELAGSEKQIAWAKTIRNNAIETINYLLCKKIADDKKELFMGIVDKYLFQQTSAKWWIDNRGMVGAYDEVMMYLQEQMKKNGEIN